MNEKNQEKLDELVVSLLQFIENSGEFVTEQAPLVIQEFLMYRFFLAAFLIVLMSFLITFFYFCVYYLGKKVKKIVEENPKYWDKDVCSRGVFYVISWVGAILCTIIGAVLIPINIVAIFKIKYAPRVYLIEELPKLIGM